MKSHNIGYLFAFYIKHPRLKHICIEILMIATALFIFGFGTGNAILYNFEDPSKDIFIDQNWTWNGTTWNTSFENHPGNFFLTSGNIKCGDRVNASIRVNFSRKCSINFKWRKKGNNAELRCYYDNKFDPKNSPTCQDHNWAQGRIADIHLDFILLFGIL